MAREWWESGFFSAVMAEGLFDAARIQEAKPEVSGILRLARIGRGAAVLDAACGVGRHSLEFARRGYQVTGVDSTPGYVRKAAALARREKLKNAAFERGELRDLYRFHGNFDLVVNLFSSFGYYQAEKDNQEALRQMAACLKPGGSLAMELYPADSIRANFIEKDWQPFSRGYLMQKRGWTQGGRRLKNEWVIALKHGIRELAWDLRVYAVDELRAMFRRAGLKRIRCFRDFKGGAWRLGDRLLIIGEKA